MGLSPRLTGRTIARAHHSPAASAFLRKIEPLFAGREVTGGPLLLATILALAMTNSPWAGGFERFWDTPITIGFGTGEVSHRLAEWIDHALLPLFFVIVGADVKREMAIGPLAHWRSAAFPLSGALGGMLVPVGLYLAVAGGTPAQPGWGAVITTDTAFGLALIAVFANRLPAGLRATMLALERQLTAIASTSASPSRAASALAFASSHAKNAASPIAPYLTTSARPAAYSRAGSVASVDVSATTTRG